MSRFWDFQICRRRPWNRNRTNSKIPTRTLSQRIQGSNTSQVAKSPCCNRQDADNLGITCRIIDLHGNHALFVVVHFQPSSPPGSQLIFSRDTTAKRALRSQPEPVLNTPRKESHSVFGTKFFFPFLKWGREFFFSYWSKPCQHCGRHVFGFWEFLFACLFMHFNGQGLNAWEGGFNGWWRIQWTMKESIDGRQEGFNGWWRIQFLSFQINVVRTLHFSCKRFQSYQDGA